MLSSGLGSKAADGRMAVLALAETKLEDVVFVRKTTGFIVLYGRKPLCCTQHATQ